MIRINDTKLVIEIDCNGFNQTPLGCLAELQTGLINMIEVANIKSNPNSLEWGLAQTVMLLKQITLTSDQMEDINKSFTQKQIDIFNRA